VTRSRFSQNTGRQDDEVKDSRGEEESSQKPARKCSRLLPRGLPFYYDTRKARAIIRRANPTGSLETRRQDSYEAIATLGVDVCLSTEARFLSISSPGRRPPRPHASRQRQKRAEKGMRCSKNEQARSFQARDGWSEANLFCGEPRGRTDGAWEVLQETRDGN